jgi:hypothetical protein
MNKQTIILIKKFIKANNDVSLLSPTEYKTILKTAKEEYKRLPRNKRFLYKQKLRKLME